MRQPTLTDKEILLREVNEAEDALAEVSQVIGCTCIIDPTETLGDRVRHLGMMAILMQTCLQELRKFQEGTDRPIPTTYSDLLRKIEEN